MFGRSLLWGMVACGILVGACGGGGDDDGPDTHPIAARYPGTRLPWPVKVSAPAMGDPNNGVVTGRRINFTAPDGIFQHQEWEGLLAAVVALDDRVVAIFPPADRVGFDLAYAGLDQPWERVPLADVAPRQVGDLDAVRDAEGTVWIAMRQRRGEQAITLYRWRPGEAVTSELVPRPGGATARAFHETCEDLQLRINDRGEQDLVFQQVYQNGHSEVVHVHRDAPGAPWQTRVVLSSEDPYMGKAILRPDRFIVVGCRNVMEHDESGRPHVLTMSQELHEQALDDVILTPLPMPRIRVAGLFLGGDGTWHHAVEGTLPDERGVRAGVPLENPYDDSDDSYLPLYDLTRHPEGYLVGGPQLPASTEDLYVGYRYLVSSLVYDFAALGVEDDVWEENQPRDFRWARTGGQLAVDECGGVWVHIEETSAGERRRFRYARNTAWCSFPARAPLVNDIEDVGDARYQVRAEGRIPYEVGLCLYGDDTLVVCDGFHTAGPADEDPARAVALVSAEPLGGALVDRAPLVITMSRPPAEGELLRGKVIDMAAGRPLYEIQYATVESGSAPGSFVVTPYADPRTVWRPGVRYRVEAWYAQGPNDTDGPSSWLFTDVPRPVAYLRDGAAPVRATDPRDEVVRFACDWNGGLRREDDGMCAFTDPRLAEAYGRVHVPIPYDHARASAPPWLELPDGTAVPSRLYTLGGNFAVEWTVALEGHTRYELVIPDDARTIVGGAIHADDRRIGMWTGAPLPEITTTVPAAGATDVDPAAPLEVTFNTPVTFPATAVSLTTGASSVPLSLLQLDTTTYRLNHAPLAPQTTYTLTFAATIQSLEGYALRDAPVVVSFTTGSGS